MQFSRTALLIGEEGLKKLKNARVAVFGIGGVGGYVVEALARSGVGALELIDKDIVSLSNINRQIIALHSTVGRYKTEVAAERAKDINPDISVTVRNTFYLPESAGEFDFASYDYVIDAIDTVSGKIALIERAKQANVPVISCMGAGNKLDATAFEVADISKTTVCPLARVMRRELKKTRDRAREGCLFQRRTEDQPSQRRGHGKTDSCQHRLCAVGGRAYSCRRVYQGFGEIKKCAPLRKRRCFFIDVVERKGAGMRRVIIF